MSEKKRIENLIRVKTELLKKWERRARAVRSRPERALLERRAAKYRRQLADLACEAQNGR